MAASALYYGAVAGATAVVANNLPSAPAAAPLPAPPQPQARAPDLTTASDRARMERESRDRAARRQGRRSTVLTGPEGVGATPLGVKTLVGS